MFCPKCNNENNSDALFCNRCGYNFKQTGIKNDDKNNFGCNLARIIVNICIGLIILFTLLGYLGKQASYNLEDISNKPLSNLFLKAHSCESDDVKNLAVQIFKENNNYYKAIESNSINQVYLRYPANVSYDSSVDRYECSGTIVMTSSNIFKPLLYEYSNSYYSTAKHHSSELDADILKGYNTYTCNIEYTSQISEGNVLVSSSSCSFNENFSCEGVCNPIILKQYNYKKNIEKVKEEQKIQKKNTENVVNIMSEGFKNIDGN